MIKLFNIDNKTFNDLLCMNFNVNLNNKVDILL